MSDVEPDPDDDDGQGLIDKMRGTGVGLEDENIVGDVGPTDVAPGADPDGSGSGDGDPLLEGAEPGEDPGEV
jgi:hypothetical protein